jgi:hypothetical protein
MSDGPNENLIVTYNDVIAIPGEKRQDLVIEGGMCALASLNVLVAEQLGLSTGALKKVTRLYVYCERCDNSLSVNPETTDAAPWLSHITMPRVRPCPLELDTVPNLN